MLLMMDVRLKRFPIHKSFWQQAKEAANQGDSINSVSMGQLVKVTVASLVLKIVAGVLVSEMEDLGLNDARRGLGLGKTSSRMTAQWGGMNLR